MKAWQRALGMGGFLLAFFALPGLAVFLYFHPYWDWETLTHSWSLAMIAGLLAYSLAMHQFLLAARLKILDRLFGHDRLLALHRWIGVSLFVLIGLHALLKNLSEFPKGLQFFLGVASGLIFGAVIVVSALLMSPLFRSRALDELRKGLRFRYQTLKVFHNLVSLAAVLVAVHVWLASSTAESLVRQLFMGAWFLVSFCLYLYHIGIRPLWLRGRTWTVESIKSEAENVLTVSLRPPEVQRWSHLSGQYAYLRFHKEGVLGEEHPFTIASPAGEFPLRFTIKKVGTFTRLLQTLIPTSQASVDGPYGHFTLEGVPSQAPLVFLAGGIGITPILSILRDLARSRSLRPIDLIWNLRSPAEAFALTEFESMRRNLIRFRPRVVFSREAPEGTLKGRLTLALIEDLISVTSDKHYFLCGPPAQMEGLLTALRRKGVPRSHLHYERFTF